jgi:hypothetical protein
MKRLIIIKEELQALLFDLQHGAEDFNKTDEELILMTKKKLVNLFKLDNAGYYILRWER